MFKSPVSVESAMSSIIIAPETMPANKLLSQLIRNRKHIALVVDEFGGTSGIVTTEDIMEEIFGEIEDEFDTDELTEKKISDEEYIFSGRLEIDYINEKYDLELKKSFEYETLAGYIFHIHEKIPAPGELISDERLNFEILKTDGPKIETVKLTIRKSSGR
jgi:CBS domain containing-hemolysin-like protein